MTTDNEQEEIEQEEIEDDVTITQPVTLTFLVSEYDEVVALSGDRYGTMACDFMCYDDGPFAPIHDQLRLMTPDNKLDIGVYRWDGHATFTLFGADDELNDVDSISDLTVEGTVSPVSRNDALVAFGVWLDNVVHVHPTGEVTS